MNSTKRVRRYGVQIGKIFFDMQKIIEYRYFKNKNQWRIVMKAVSFCIVSQILITILLLTVSDDVVNVVRSIGFLVLIQLLIAEWMFLNTYMRVDYIE